MSKAKNFAAFWSLCKRLRGLEVSKEELVLQWTNGRTSSLREMYAGEYNAMLRALNEEAGFRPSCAANAELRAMRSKLLHLAQQLGVDTANWEAVDAFFCQSRIAGKAFRAIELEEAETVRKRLLAIRRKQAKTEQAAAPRNECKYLIINQKHIGKC